MEEPKPRNGKKDSGLSVVRGAVNTPDYGKIPPQAVDLEEAVLGALMLDKEALTDVIDILKKESFYKDDHKMIYEAILDLFQRSEPIDILTVTQELKKRGELEIIGGPFYIAQLTNRVASSANVEFHARIISQKHIQRELIRISSETIKMAYDETVDVFDLLDGAEAKLFEVAEGNIRRSYEDMNKLLHKAVKQLELISKSDGTSGVPTGFANLDRVTGGFQKSDMIVLAARPGMGKTAFVLSLARNAAVDYKKGVAVFSLEMSSLQLVNRLISSETEIAGEKLKKGNLEPYEWEQLNSRIGKLTNAPIYINDTPGLSIFELRAQCRRLKAEKDIQMVIIDYLQLMTATVEGKGNREQEISAISRAVKGIAKELEVPVIALSQLSRAVETRGGDKRPQLSDLRESGAIEQDADMVMFIYRPEYYGITADEDGNSTQGLSELIIAKHRNGSTEDVKIRFQNHLAKFVNWENDNFDLNGPSVDVEDDYGRQVLRSSNFDNIDDKAEEPPF
ncbi:MAG TPA: replicative DNA helicase [Flavobacteriales bacterium]|nr:replicative DNA helicase [Flavobacteriales bacterium]HAW20100.1 replicative DNA helicase [Flavobacteriales bacterium]